MFEERKLMVPIAILHPTLPGYFDTIDQNEKTNIEVVTSANQLQPFVAQLADHDIQALVVELELLGDDPKACLARLEADCNPELTLVVHSFAKWSLLESLRGAKRQLLRAPVSPRALKSSMVGLIVRRLTGADSKPANKPVDVLTNPAPIRQYNPVQLMHLQQIRSVVDCECPNQVADLVLALNAFEDYSAQCKNRNPQDAQMHSMLARATGHARATMEKALAELCEFEQIDVSDLGRRAS